MSKIPRKDLIALFRKMYDEHWIYTWGHAIYGDVDCSGAFVYAYKQYGKSIYHGSNTIARKHVVKLLPISQAKPGYAAFKCRDDGDEPDQYKSDGKGNFYHIGLVDETGQYVLNAKSTKTGFSRDKLSSWQFVAELKEVDYSSDTGYDVAGETEKVLMKAIVTTQSGALNIRSTGSASAVRLGSAPKGAEVNVLDLNDGDWYKISYKGTTGYAKAEFLTVSDSDTSSGNGDAQTTSSRSLEDRVTEIEIKLDAIINQIGGID